MSSDPKIEMYPIMWDYTSGSSNPSNLAARVQATENVRIEIHIPFAVYLAQVQNRELYLYLQQKGQEIERFLKEIEQRVNYQPPQSA